ncbi:MAG TPA: hypothetical protein VGO62_13865, partial [Myxococcota bacterium]
MAPQQQRKTGPILVTTGEFEMLTTRDFGPGPVVVLPARHPVVIGAGLCVLTTLIACAVLAIDRNSKVDDAERAKLAYSAAEEELTATKAEIHTTDAIVKDMAVDRAELGDIKGADQKADAKALEVEKALKS